MSACNEVQDLGCDETRAQVSAYGEVQGWGRDERRAQV